MYYNAVAAKQCKVGEEMISSQLLKGALDSCILKIVSCKETYGYLIVQKLNDLGLEIQEGTVYPILLRLEKKRFLKSERRALDIDPVRKYLSITDEGLKEIERFKDEWSILENIVDKIMDIEV
ncbi:PadR family transcriptional regulator [Tissierella sp.]|uniref:PadR family transcriptional regulator n=1 Tax=Tissierella sp. TaxID=41274 RepID=UPI0028A6E467|nr:PadR family transcriptional regulator [Tissierella sp.]